MKWIRRWMFVKQIKRRFHYVHFNHHYSGLQHCVEMRHNSVKSQKWSSKRRYDLSQFSLIFSFFLIPHTSKWENHKSFVVQKRITNHSQIVKSCMKVTRSKFNMKKKEENVNLLEWFSISFVFDDKKFCDNFHSTGVSLTFLIEC